jgi:hypothetical protein
MIFFMQIGSWKNIYRVTQRIFQNSFAKKIFYYFYLTLVKGQCLEKYAMGRAAIPYMEGAVGRDLAISEIIEGEQQAIAEQQYHMRRAGAVGRVLG